MAASHESEQNRRPDIISLNSDHLDKKIVFEPVYMIIETHPDLDPATRSSLAEEVRMIEKQAFGEPATSSLLLWHRLCSVGVVAPDVLNMIIFILATPVADFDVLAVEAARKLRDEQATSLLMRCNPTL